MNRPQKDEEKCRRMEFKCKLYGIIKELDRSLKSECGYSKSADLNESSGRQHYEAAKDVNKRKGSECCCPPGCCKESMEFRMPRLPPKEKPLDPADTQGQGVQNGEGTGYLGWHDESHAWGCRPVGEAWPGSQCGRWCQEYGGRSSAEGVSHVSQYGTGGSAMCDVGASNYGGGRRTSCCGGSPNYIDSGNAEYTPAFQFPQNPEEAIARGCFVARSA